MWGTVSQKSAGQLSRTSLVTMLSTAAWQQSQKASIHGHALKLVSGMGSHTLEHWDTYSRLSTTKWKYQPTFKEMAYKAGLQKGKGPPVV